MSKGDILLRILNNPPLATKGSQLTSAEADANFVILYNALVSLSQSSHVDAYSAAITYENGEYVQYVNQLYRMIAATPQTNVTPGTVPAAAVWLPVYASDLVQAPTDLKPFKKTIPSAEVLTMGVGDTPVEIIPALGEGKSAQIVSGNGYVDFDTGSPGGVPYDANTTIYIYPNGMDVGGGDRIFELGDLLKASVPQAIPFRPRVPTYDDAVNELPPNTAIMAAVNGGNPGSGDSDIVIQGLYREIDFS